MKDLAFSKEFWATTESFVNTCSLLITNFQENVMKKRGKEYDDAINEKWAPLDRCAGFIYCTNIKMCLPSGPNVNQRVLLSGQKRNIFLIY